jgi:hypothetical protein
VAAPAAVAEEDDSRPATREEAGAAFLRGCLKRVDVAPPELSREKKRIICEDARDCIIDALFTRDGGHKRPFSEVGGFVVPCVARARRKALDRAGGTLWAGEPVRMEIVRPESNGLMNSVPAVVAFEGVWGANDVSCRKLTLGSGNHDGGDEPDTVLFGGDRVICIVPTPEVRIAVSTPRSRRPPGFSPASRSWDAARITPRFGNGQTVRLVVTPRSHGSAYVGGWLLRASALD